MLTLSSSHLTSCRQGVSHEPFRARPKGLDVSDDAACACHRRVPAALRFGRVKPDVHDFAQQPSSNQEIRGLVRRADQARWALEVHRTSHPRASAVDFARRLAQSLDSPRDPSSPLDNAAGLGRLPRPWTPAASCAAVDGGSPVTGDFRQSWISPSAGSERMPDVWRSAGGVVVL